MLATTLRDVLLKEAVQGRRPAVVVMDIPNFTEFIADLTNRRDVFEPVVFQGVQVVSKDMILWPVGPTQA